MIKRVEYSRVTDLGPEGLRIVFLYEGRHQEEHTDTFDFYMPEDVSPLLSMMQYITPEMLMLEIRNRMRITVH